MTNIHSKKKLDSTTQSPTSLTQPALVEATSVIDDPGQLPTIKQVVRKKKEILGTGKHATNVGRPFNKDDEDLVSFNEEAGKGTIQAGEFIPVQEIPILINFKDFTEAIRILQRLCPTWEVKLELSKVPIESPIAYCNGIRRSYVLVTVKSQEQTINILEIESTDGKRLSTLLFKNKNFNQQYRILKIIQEGIH